MITETDIRQWADCIEARSLLPVLVRRLVRETTPGLTSIRFPGNDAVALHGVDGSTEADASTLWVPNGTAFWEMGCNQSLASKAQDDYDKRIKGLDEKTRRLSAFVFVTPRRWPGKEQWLTERRAQGDWAKVHAWDVVDIETWLDEAPATRLWLAERLGLTQRGLASPEDWYRGWASASTPNIPARLVADRRGGMGESLIRKLREGDRAIPIVADSRQEAVAFCIAALVEADAGDLLDRMMVVTSPDAVPGAGTGPKPILVLDLPHNEKPALFDRDRFQIIPPMAKGEAALREQLELPHVGAEAFREALEEAGLSRDEAQRLALEVGHSVTVLRRRLSDDPAVRLPPWAHDPGTARKLLPHALAGGWTEGERHDDIAMLSLLAETSEEDVARTGRELVRGEDAPLVRIGNVTMTVSQLDALFALGPHIEPGDLDRFFLLMFNAIGERDPKLDLPEDEWWCANIYGKSRAYSAALLSGLGDTLGILATYGDAICGNRLGVDLHGRIDRHVRDLMSGMTPDAWVSIRPHLRALAEAAPIAFLDCVEADLDRLDHPISSIMRCVGDAGLSRECLRTELLWALEALAWSPKHFPRVAEVVLRLCAFEANDDYVNNPVNTAAALFRAWLPSTTLNVEGRMDVLRRLAPRYRSAAIDICKSLIERDPTFASRTSMPRWLTVEGNYEAVTNHDLWNAGRAASALLLDLAPLDDVELLSVLGALDCLHVDDQERLCAEVERWSKDADDKAKASLAKVVRTELGQLQFRRQHADSVEETDSESDALLPMLDRMLEQLQPRDLRQRHLWLFEQDHIQWPDLDRDEAEGRISWREREALVQARRRDALHEIESAHGTDALYAFAVGLEHPYIAACALSGMDAPEAQKISWASRAMCDAEGGVKAETFLAQVLLILDEDLLAKVVGAIEEAGLMNRQDRQERLGRCLPNVAAGWRLAERIGGKVQEAYWSNSHIHISSEEDAAEAELVARRLMEAGRPRSAYRAACVQPKKLSTSLWIEILQCIIRGDQPDGPLPDLWHLVRILQLLDMAADVSDAQIAALEWPFARLLKGYGAGSKRPVWAIHRLLMAMPSEYVGLLSWQYPRSDSTPEPDMESIDSEQRRLCAELTNHVFRSWSQIPGTREDGSLDEAAFRQWSSEMLRLSGEQGRLQPALSCLAGCLARVAKRRDLDEWLPEVVLAFLDRPELSELRQSLEIGVRNARGVTMRGCYDGGAQERTLAKQYRQLAERSTNGHPRVAAMLESIAKSYEWDAKRADEEAQLGERWQP